MPEHEAFIHRIVKERKKLVRGEVEISRKEGPNLKSHPHDKMPERRRERRLFLRRSRRRLTYTPLSFHTLKG